jgi:hypothetical protein
MTTATAKEYARFIRFAVGPGQTPGTAAGTLPEGYAPLPTALRRRALAVADQVQARVGPPGQKPPADQPAGNNGGNGGNNGGGNGGGTTTPGGTGATAPPATVPPSAAPTPATQPDIKAAGARTPGDPSVATRFAIVAVLILGIGGAILGPLLPRLARRLGQ